MPLQKASASLFSSHSSSLVNHYNSLVKNGLLRSDTYQLQCLAVFDQLLLNLQSYKSSYAAFEKEQNIYETQWQRALPEIQQSVEIEIQKEKEGDSWGSRVLNTIPLPYFFSSSRSNDNNINSIHKSEEDKKIAADATMHATMKKNALREYRIHQRMIEILGPIPSSPSPPKGIYIHGSVGSGKSLLMDMLYKAAVQKSLMPYHRRVHCNAALLELHSRMHSMEKSIKNGASINDIERAKQAKIARIALRRMLRERNATPIEEYSAALGAGNAKIMLEAARGFLGGSPSLLCFDEMQTSDPYNVAALKALTEATVCGGGVMIATSNRAPSQLARHGLHEDMFDHFVATLEDSCEVLQLGGRRSGGDGCISEEEENAGNAVDYRRVLVAQKRSQKRSQKSYFYPLNESNKRRLRDLWDSIDAKETSVTIPVMFGREMRVEKCKNRAAWFEFDDLCARPLGPADYVALASSFDTLFIEGVPAMSMRVRDKARRFITMIDEVYNAKIRLYCTAEVEPDLLFVDAEGSGEESLGDSIAMLEGLQFEGSAEGGRLKRNVLSDGGVSPVNAKIERSLGGAEERFAFARAVSRLHELECFV